MGFINLAEKTINAKLVYYGVGLGGKTTSLKVVHQVMCPRDDVKLVSINTEQDSTLLFDFLPIDIGQVEGFKIRVQGFTVPGQQKYVVMRKYVLQGADAVVLVVDSRTERIQENLQSIEELKANLEANGLDWKSIPMVIQYNKRDLPGLIPSDELGDLFKFRDVPAYQSVATRGDGVFDAFVDVVGSMVEEKVRQYGLDRGEITAESVAEEAREKLRGAQQGAEEAGAWQGQGLLTLSVGEDASAPVEVLTEASAPTPEAKETVDQESVDQKSPDREASIQCDRDKETAAVDYDIEEQATGLLGQAISSNLELAELYAELAAYKQLLEKKNRELVEVNQLVSHDLKKPLTVFKTVISLMHQGRLGELNAKQTDAVQNCAESVRYMEDLISDILDSSRLDYDGQEFDFREVDMTLLIGALVRRLRHHLEDQSVRVRVDPLPVVCGDESALQKVFMNLIGNAVNYRDPNREGLIRISGREEHGAWVLRVADNGIGIPEPDQLTIWQKFKRGANTQGVSGTGLGLYIVHQLVRGHGGAIDLESTVGEGTTFAVRLPKAPVVQEHSPLA